MVKLVRVYYGRRLKDNAAQAIESEKVQAYKGHKSITLNADCRPSVVLAHIKRTCIDDLRSDIQSQLSERGLPKTDQTYLKEMLQYLSSLQGIQLAVAGSDKAVQTEGLSNSATLSEVLQHPGTGSMDLVFRGVGSTSHEFVQAHPKPLGREQSIPSENAEVTSTTAAEQSSLGHFDPSSPLLINLPSQKL